MAIRHLLTVVRRPCSKSLRALSISYAAAAGLSSPPPPSSNPDSRFLKYNSPHATLTDHCSILASPVTRVTTLPSGLRVATESNLASKTASVIVYIESGSRFEDAGSNGTGNFLQHMIFTGTEKRNERELMEEIENMGMHLNSYTTSRELTNYYANVMEKDVPNSLDILADILQNSEFNEEKINEERENILSEIEEVDDEKGQEFILNHLHSTAFRNSPLGLTIVGPVINIERITKTYLQDYLKLHYIASRMVISASGAVKHDDLVEQVKKLFTELPTSANSDFDKKASVFRGAEIRMVDNDIPLARFAVGFNGASWTDPDAIALMVLQKMLGSWDKKTSVCGTNSGSPLVERIAVKKLCENMEAFNTNYKDTGIFGVYAAAKPDCLYDLSCAITYELCKLNFVVSQDDVLRACNQLKSSMILEMNGTTLVAENIGRQILTYGRRIPNAELFARIDAVDATTIKRVAHRFIFNRDFAIAAVGPIRELPNYEWFKSRTSGWHRY